jgi:hypothetical protein
VCVCVSLSLSLARKHTHVKHPLNNLFFSVCRARTLLFQDMCVRVCETQARIHVHT